MASQLATIEPILPPDVRRPAKLTTLPLWVVQRCDILRREHQPDRAGIHREVPVLPAEMILGNDQKILIERHLAALGEVIEMTPATDERHGEVTMIAVTKMMLVLPSRESGDLANEAKGEAYMAALEDVPSWAVQEAMRKWHRSEYGARYDYKWQPAPATLRELALVETYRVMGVRRRLNDLLLAEPLTQFSQDHRERMKAKLSSFGFETERSSNQPEKAS